MSQAAAKASRRAIRKAVGPEAIDVINSHAASITDIIAEMGACNQRVKDLEALTEFYAKKFAELTTQTASDLFTLNLTLANTTRWERAKWARTGKWPKRTSR